MNPREYRHLLIPVALVVVATWAGVGIATYRYAEGDLARAGQLGDMFGAVNALFSGLAFVGVIFAILLQREELELQRKELRDTRAEFRQQNATLIAQRFENTFFQLLKSHNDIVSALRLVETDGRQCFQRLYEEFRRLYRSANMQGEQGSLDRIDNAYFAFYASFEPHVGHYFRNLYHIVRFVDESEIENKRRYTKFLRAQLSSNELSLLFYNCLSRYGIENFKPLIERYSLLQNLNTQSLVYGQRDMRNYQRTAFATPP